MDKVAIAGMDLAKNVLQLHAAEADGRADMKKRLARTRFVKRQNRPGTS